MILQQKKAGGDRMKSRQRILFIPLDERPCNYEFPFLLSQGTELELVRPPKEMLGNKKLPADLPRLWSWLEQEAATAHGAILALDTLLYGGIVPSRLHDQSPAELAEQLERLRMLRERCPNLQHMYAFQLIMRCPQYSLADEEPDYYANWGREIFRKGYIEHRHLSGLATDEELIELKHIDTVLPAGVLKDYLDRREVNALLNRAALELVSSEVIDFLIIPQDDSAPYGWTARDQQKVRERIAELDLELQVYMYPGADEVACTLLARMLNRVKGVTPLLYPRMSSDQGALVTPLFEDRHFGESLKYQILAAGGLMVSSAAEADVILLANTPGDTMAEAVDQQQASAGYDVQRNIIELIEYAAYVQQHWGKPVAIADVGYANGADLKLLRLLRRRGLLFKLAGYAGWNTSSNTLGTVIAQSMVYAHYGATQEHLDFLALRYTEDACYCAVVRMVMNERIVDGMGLSKFELDGPRGCAATIVREQLELVIRQMLLGSDEHIQIHDCYMPWNRTFEVGLHVSYEGMAAVSQQSG